MAGGNIRGRGSHDVPCGRGNGRYRGQGHGRGRGRGRGRSEGVAPKAYHTLEEIEEVQLVAASAYTWGQRKNEILRYIISRQSSVQEQDGNTSWF